MSEKRELFISRSRLFALENTVSFSGDVATELEIDSLNRALALLCERHSLLRSKMILENDGGAFVVDGEAADFEQMSGELDEITEAIRAEGIDFSRRLFRFVLVNKSSVAIFGHTAVCDVASLAILAGELIAFYNRESFEISAVEPVLVSGFSEMPQVAISPVTQRVTNSINYSWLKYDRVFSESDYKKGVAKYKENRDVRFNVRVSLSAEDTEAIRSRCEEKGVDVSSAVAFAFYNALYSELGSVGKSDSVLCQCNLRLFMRDSQVYGVGPLNSDSAIKIRKKPKKDESPLEAFSREVYKRHATCYSAFYDAAFSAQLLPSLCDATHLYEAGTVKNKKAGKIARRQLGLRESTLGFCFQNFDEQYWTICQCFENIRFSEPFSNRMRNNLNIVSKNGELSCELQFKVGQCPYETAQKICENAIEAFKNL